MIHSRSRPRQPQTRIRMQCEDGPKDNCKCYHCYVLHQAEDSDDDAGLDNQGDNFDFNKLSQHWGIAANLNFAKYDKTSPTTHGENIPKVSEQELEERKKYKDFVNQFERDLSEARDINFENFVSEMLNSAWTNMRDFYLQCKSRISSRIEVWFRGSRMEAWLSGGRIEAWLRGGRIYPFNPNVPYVSYYKYPYNIWGKKSS